MKTIDPQSLVPMDNFTQEYPLRIDLAYARADNLLLKEAIYRPDARLWLHQDLAKIVCRAAKICFEKHGFRFVLHDGLRTVEAQARMLTTECVKQNQHWLEVPRLLSPPGSGGHPRAMAVDISLEMADGKPVDMGTAFDFLAADPGPEKNPAHRDYPGHSAAIMQNRAALTGAMLAAAQEAGIEILPLPQEWWDFRYPAALYEQYAPLSDADLPPDMRMCSLEL